MPFLRSLLLLLALVSPAFSQDGPHDAATAQDAGQAFGIYLDGVLKSGGEPDFTKLVAEAPATVKDRETQKNLIAFAGALAAAK